MLLNLLEQSPYMKHGTGPNSAPNPPKPTHTPLCRNGMIVKQPSYQQTIKNIYNPYVYRFVLSTFFHLRMYICTHMSICIHIYIYMQRYMYSSVPTYMCIFMYGYVNIYTPCCSYICTHQRIYIHTSIYTHVQVCMMYMSQRTPNSHCQRRPPLPRPSFRSRAAASASMRARSRGGFSLQVPREAEQYGAAVLF